MQTPMGPVTALDPPTLSAAHALPLIELLAQQGIPPDRLLQRVGLTEAALVEPGVRLELEVVQRIVAEARELSRDPGLGILLGLRARVTSFGFAGFAALSASSLGHAAQLATHLGALSPTALRVRLRLEGDVAALVMEERATLGGARDVVLLALAIGLWRMGCTLTGKELPCEIELAFGEPSYFRSFAQRCPVTRFGQPLNQVVFGRWVLELPIATADPVALRLAREQCERGLARTTEGTRLVERGDGPADRRPAGLLERVQHRPRLPPLGRGHAGLLQARRGLVSAVKGPRMQMLTSPPWSARLT